MIWSLDYAGGSVLGGRAKRRNHRLTFAVLAAGVGTYSLLQSLILPVLPTIQHSLHTSQADVTWVLTMYLLSASIFTPIIGRLGDMWGKQHMLLVALAGLASGCVVSALAGSIWVMILGRAVQGIGGGLIPLSFGIIRDEFPRRNIPGAVGALAALSAAIGGFGLVIAGPIVSALSYRWMFWIPAILMVLSIIAAKFVVPESPVRIAGRVNWVATGLFSLWLAALLLGLSEGPEWGWGSPRIIGLLTTAGIVAAVWVVVEQRSSCPLIDMRMMRVPVVWTANLVALLIGVGMYATFAFLPQLLQTPKSSGYGFGTTVTVSGLVLLPQCLVMFVAGMSCGRLTLRYGAKTVLVTGALLDVIPFVMLVVARSELWEIVVALGIMGAGFGLTYTAMSTLIVQGVPADQTGVASGMNANIRTIGGAIGAAAMTSVVTATAHNGSLPTDAGYTRGFLLLALASVGAAGAALLVPGKLRTPSPTELEEALPHPELGIVAGGTLLGDMPE
jgi:EmrB/QacA subfamily drug resistance transporter